MIKECEIPDVRDGLTTLQRRILWTMKNMGLSSKRSYSIAIDVTNAVAKGENLDGFEHRCGWIDTADYGYFGVYNIIYCDNIVKMTQNFRYPFPLIQGHGNFGIITGEYNAAAQRFTGCRLSEFSKKLLLSGLNQRIVKYIAKPNRINGKEPSILPVAIPNVLVSGTSGSSHIPPHNLGEVIDAVIAMIKNPNLKPEELFEYIKGPDFPTGGTIINKSELPEIYQNGAGEIRIRGTMKTGTSDEGEQQIVIKEIPYTMICMVEELIENIEHIKRSCVLPNIISIENSGSRRQKINIIITLNKSADIQNYTELLYEYTNLESSFDYRALLNSNEKPCLMSLHQILYEWLDFYRETKTKQNGGVTPADDELIDKLQEIKDQFATPRKTKIIDAM